VVAVKEVAPFESLVIAAGELGGEELAAFEEWEAEADEPYEG
jgi:hypothetical protein